MRPVWRLYATRTPSRDWKDVSIALFRTQGWVSGTAREGRFDGELLGFFALTEGGRQAPRRRQLFFQQIHAELAAWCGHFDDAVDALGHAATHGLIDAFWMDQCPLLAPLGSDPGFQQARVHHRADRVRPAYLRAR